MKKTKRSYLFKQGAGLCCAGLCCCLQLTVWFRTFNVYFHSLWLRNIAVIGKRCRIQMLRSDHGQFFVAMALLHVITVYPRFLQVILLVSHLFLDSTSPHWILISQFSAVFIWRCFPNHPFYSRIFPYEPSIWGCQHFRKSPFHDSSLLIIISHHYINPWNLHMGDILAITTVIRHH